MAASVLKNDVSYGAGDDFIELDEGTYYFEYKSALYMDSSSNHTTKIMIGAMPQGDPIKVEQMASADRKQMISIALP